MTGPPQSRSSAMARPQTIVITGASDGIGAEAARLAIKTA
jgi:short-subunit dehydrogenase